MSAQDVGTRWGDIVARLVGWRAGMVIEAAVFDRWCWMRRHITAGARTLDAGSGSGWFSMYTASRGSETVGVSFNEDANAAARRRAKALGLEVTIVDADLREVDRLGPELGTFGQIICFETVEHIRDDRKLVSDLAELLEPGGHLLITTPFAGHRPWIGEDEDPDEAGGHVRRGYEHDELAALVTSANLTPVARAYLSGLVSQKILCLRARLSQALGYRVATIVTVPLLALRPLDRFLTAVTKYPYMCVAIVAAKPAA
jgi:SAM-dependent methyltransferase